MTAFTIRDLFLAIFSADDVAALGLQTKAFVRKTAVGCVPFVLGLLAACCGGDKRSIAAAHRAFEALAGKQVARSTFDERVESPHTVVNGIRRVPVTDAEGRFVGLVDEVAIAKAYLDRQRTVGHADRDEA